MSIGFPKRIYDRGGRKKHPYSAGRETIFSWSICRKEQARATEKEKRVLRGEREGPFPIVQGGSIRQFEERKKIYFPNVRMGKRGKSCLMGEKVAFAVFWGSFNMSDHPMREEVRTRKTKGNARGGTLSLLQGGEGRALFQGPKKKGGSASGVGEKRGRKF